MDNKKPTQEEIDLYLSILGDDNSWQNPKSYTNLDNLYKNILKNLKVLNKVSEYYELNKTEGGKKFKDIKKNFFEEIKLLCFIAKKFDKNNMYRYTGMTNESYDAEIIFEDKNETQKLEFVSARDHLKDHSNTKDLREKGYFGGSISPNVKDETIKVIKERILVHC